MDFGHEEHPSASAEAGQKLQNLAVAGSLLEAVARLRVENLRRQEKAQQDQAAQEETARRLQEQQDKLAAYAARKREQDAAYAARKREQEDQRLVTRASDPDWVAQANVLDLGRAWGAARLHEGQDNFPQATAAAEAVEQRLREMYPHPMDLYDRAVRQGTPREDAMRAAAAEMARTPVMRAHGGGRAGALGPAENKDSEVATPLTDEQMRLATGLNLDDYLAALTRMGPGGEAAAKELREELAAQAGREIAQGRADAAAPDDPHTTSVDEHTTVGLPHSAADMSAANRDTAAANTRTAAEVAGQFHPEGLQAPGGPKPTQPAGRPSPAQRQAPGRTPRRTR